MRTATASTRKPHRMKETLGARRVILFLLVLLAAEASAFDNRGRNLSIIIPPIVVLLFIVICLYSIWRLCCNNRKRIVGRTITTAPATTRIVVSGTSPYGSAPQQRPPVNVQYPATPQQHYPPAAVPQYPPSRQQYPPQQYPPAQPPYPPAYPPAAPNVPAPPLNYEPPPKYSEAVEQQQHVHLPPYAPSSGQTAQPSAPSANLP